MDSLLAKVDVAFGTLSRLLLTMRMSAYVISVYAIVQGLLVILGGMERFSAPGYNTAASIPGAPALWGWGILLAGIISFTGVKNRMYRVGEAGMFLGAVWSLLFGLSFLISAIQIPDANLTAIAVYGKDAVLFVLMASGHRDMARQRLNEGIPDAEAE